ncbi:CARDB domain-containing protein [Kordia sp.]|uniref:CARDB domain-containing protein n=1 Tax=Kordia sp. TaxID=1965332 RepID=UPI003D2CD348
MKKIISYLFIAFSISSYGQIQHLYADWNNSTETYSSPQLFTSRAISEDYGPRPKSGYDFHGGIDIGKDDSTNPSILGDAIVTPLNGEVVFIDDSGVKNILVKYSNNEYVVYRHIFEGGSSGIQESGGFVMKTTNEGTLTIINLKANPIKAISTANGDTVSYDLNNNGIIESNETFTTSNTFNQFQLIAPIGNSVGFAAHLHVQSVKELKNSAGNTTTNIDNINEVMTFNDDSNTFNPLYDFNYTGIAYNVIMTDFSSLNQNSYVKIRTEVPEEHRTGLIKRYENGMFDVQNISLKISRYNEDSFLKMKKSDGNFIEFDFGSKSNGFYPEEMEDVSEVPNEWKITPTAYWSGTTNNYGLYDDYYLALTDFNSRAINPNIQDIDNNGMAEINNESLYGDGLYRMKAVLEPVEERNPFFYSNIGPFQSSVSEPFIIDNFYPYVERVLVIYSLLDVYHKRWERDGNSMQLNGSNGGAIFENGDEFHVRVFSSEPLESLNLQVDGISTVFSLTPNISKTQWDIDLVYSGTTIQRDLIFTGLDTNNNELLKGENIANLNNHVIQGSGLGQGITFDNGLTGEDRTHKINNLDDCQVTANAGLDVTIQNGESIQLQGTGGSIFSWSPTTGLNNPNIWNPIATPSQTTTYTLTVTENGCSDTDQVTVIVNNSSGGGNEPTNDNCNDAISLISSTSCNSVYGSVDFATREVTIPTPPCDSHQNPNGFGVFYSFIAVSNTHTITVDPTGTLDAVVSVYRGSFCPIINPWDCEDTPGGNGVTTILTNNNFTIGGRYWIRVYDFGNIEPPIGQGGFNICVTHDNSSSGTGIDLISNITNVNDNNPDAGDQISINYSVKNIGDTSTSTLPTISFYLSSNQNLTNSDDFLNSEAILQTISINQTVNGDILVDLPNISDGQYYLVSAVDNIGFINESNENNNLDFFPIQIGQVNQNGPDLDITGMTVIANSGLAPNQEINIELEIDNDGNQDADNFDVLYFLDIDGDEEYDVNEFMRLASFGEIDAGDDRVRDRDMFLPSGIPSIGSYKVIAIADYNNEINETDEDNNDKSRTVGISTITPAGPDIICDFVKWEINGTTTQVSPQNLCLNEEYRVYWEITNIGSLDVSGGFQVSHKVYISQDEFFDGSDIFFDSSNINAGSHDVGQVFERDDNNNWEGVSPGDYYLLLIADEDQEIAEINEQNNVRAFPITLNNCNNSDYPDLAIEITNYTPYASALGDYITVDMIVSNLGSVDVTDNIDVELFLSDDQIFHGDGGSGVFNDHQLTDNGLLVINQDISAGSSINISMTAYTLSDNGSTSDPINSTGIKYLFAAIDEGGDFIETDRTNNIDFVPIEFTSVDCYYNFDNEIPTVAYDDTLEDLFLVRTEDDCTYIVDSVEDWITSPNNSSETGTEYILAFFQQNPYPFPRTGHINVGPEVFEFVQEARPCEFLDESIKMSLSSQSITDIDCINQGKIEITMQNGFPTYTYSWSNGTSDRDLINITTAGDYTLTVTDISGCTFEQTFTIGENLTLDTTVTNNGGILTSNQSDATYQWLDCSNSSNTPIANETDETFTPTSNGEYAVEITYGNCTEISECVMISTLSTEEINKEKIKIYPNPAQDILTINLGRTYSKVNLEIYNIVGQRINTLEFETKQILTINTSLLSSGIYFFKIKTDTMKSKEFKVIKE